MATWEDFRQCPGCGYDFATDVGERSCHLYECPYLPAELDVFCPQCRFNFQTDQGNPACADPDSCEHGVEARDNVEHYRRWRDFQPVS